MIAFIDDHRAVYGVEPICRVLPIAPSTYHAHAARRADPAQAAGPGAARCRPCRPRSGGCARRTSRSTACARSGGSCGAKAIAVARCTVARLMRQMGLQGVVRGKTVRTTISDKAAPCPLDRVNRQFQAPRPNVLWVSDFTYVATWAGFVYVAFVIDAYARRIVGWRVSRTAHAGFVLDALEQALHERRPVHGGGLVHHSDRGVAIRLDPLHRAPGRGRHRALGRQRRRQLRQRSRRDDQRPLQGRGDPSARPMAHASRPSSSPRSNGSTGSTTAGCSSRSATSRPPKPRRATMPRPRTSLGA